jgi:hypothetical protein
MTANRLRTRKTSLALAALLALGAAPVDDSQAAACTFNPASGNWNVAANWNCGFVPGSTDTAVVAAGRSVTVTGAQPTTSVEQRRHGHDRQQLQPGVGGQQHQQRCHHDAVGGQLDRPDDQRRGFVERHAVRFRCRTTSRTESMATDPR